jgi:hypothetical protein
MWPYTSSHIKPIHAEVQNMGLSYIVTSCGSYACLFEHSDQQVAFGTEIKIVCLGCMIIKFCIFKITNTLTAIRNNILSGKCTNFSGENMHKFFNTEFC